MNIKYDSHYNSDSNNITKFVDVDLLFNKLSIQLLANNYTTPTKKCRINKTNKKAGKALKTNVI